MNKARVIFLEGKKTILRPPNKETDLEIFHQWINDSELLHFLGAYRPKSKHEESLWFDRLSERKDDIIFAIETKGGETIGVIGIHSINWKDRTATTGAFIGIKKYWGKGYGTDAKMILLNYAFNELNLRKMNSAVISYNKRSLAYSLHCGYKIEGKEREAHYKRGKYWDKIILGVFKHEWLPYWRKYKKSRR